MSKIKQWIKKGEGKTIEFKRTLRDGNHIAKTVIAFSNMAGGLFLKIIIYKKKRQQTTIEITKETTKKTSGESEKITSKTLSEKDISTSGETTAKDNGNTTTKTTMDTQRETIDDGFGDKKTTTKTTVETTAKTTGKDSKETTAKTETAVTKEPIDDNFKNKKTTTKAAPETTAKTSIMLIELIRKKPNASLNELAEHLQLTRDGVRYHLKNLKQKGILKRIGSSREGYWKINEDRIPK